MQGLKDDLQGKAMEFSREIALKDQSIEFLKRRIEESSSHSDERTKELEERLASVKADRASQLQE